MIGSCVSPNPVARRTVRLTGQGFHYSTTIECTEAWCSILLHINALCSVLCFAGDAQRLVAGSSCGAVRAVSRHPAVERVVRFAEPIG